MRNYHLLYAGIVMILVSGCGGTQVVKAPVDIPSGVDERLIYSSEDKRPAWTLEEPATVNGTMSFVGLSGNFATEQLARDDARRNAVSRVVNYSGTLVKDKFERVRAGYGLASNVADPTTSSLAFEKQLAVNVARQVKDKKIYLEKWQTPTGIAYRAFLLAEVPEKAIDDSMKTAAHDMARKAEQQAKEAGDEVAKKQFEKATEMFKQISEQGLTQ